MTLSYRSIWLSDVHLGTRSSRAAELLDFLKAVKADKIYLVGDIIDLERMSSRPMFPKQHLAVIGELVRLARLGTEVVFIPGNHDHQFRSLAGQEVLGIPILPEAVHETPNGERWLVMHGDILDGRIRAGTRLERFGAAAYAVLTEADILINKCRRGLGKDYVSISAGIKARLRGAQEYIRRFESVAVSYAAERGFDGVVCGHIHKPNIRRIGDCLYANDGDWVEHGTALAETADGELQMLTWQTSEIVVGVLESRKLLAA